jgi:nicotinate-nucleotide pyrophosphorylase (carboxylating)
VPSSDDWLSPATSRLIDLALEEDLGRGDVTTASVVDADARAAGRILTREPIVVAGLTVAAEVFRRVDPAIEIDRLVEDGAHLPTDATLLTFRGPARGLLMAERTALNFLQRLSGIATVTHKFTDLCQGTATRVADTRKTSPGARALEKLAVRAGGGVNHRADLGSGVLIKDNHVALAGGVREAVRRARAGAPHGLRIEVEVDTLAQLDEALDAGADIVLLDNFTTADITIAVERARARTPRPLVEISGGVTLSLMPELCRLGVDIISVGALTHSARAVDLSMELSAV